MNKEEFYYINEQRLSYMEIIMSKYRGMDYREKRKSYYAKLDEWRDITFEKYHTEGE